MVKVRYQDRPDYVAEQAWSRGYLKPLEFFRVAAWKTGQGLGSLTLKKRQVKVTPVTGILGDCR
jgi:hypothetical protein